MSGFLTSMIQWIITVLPADPIQGYIEALNMPYLGWVNWFIPVGTLAGIATAWGVGISSWYLWSALARFLHLTD